MDTKKRRASKFLSSPRSKSLSKDEVRKIIKVLSLAIENEKLQLLECYELIKFENELPLGRLVHSINTAKKQNPGFEDLFDLGCTVLTERIFDSDVGENVDIEFNNYNGLSELRKSFAKTYSEIKYDAESQQYQKCMQMDSDLQVHVSDMLEQNKPWMLRISSIDTPYVSWSLNHGQAIRVVAFAFSLDGQQMASALSDGQLCLWNLQTKTMYGQGTIPGRYDHNPPEPARKAQLSFSHRGEHILVSWNKGLFKAELPEGMPEGTSVSFIRLHHHGSDINSIARVANDQLVFVGSTPESAVQKLIFFKSDPDPNSAINPLDRAGKIMPFGQQNRKPDPASAASRKHLAYSRTNQEICLAENRTLFIWDTQGDLKRKRLPKNIGSIRCVEYSLDGVKMVLGTAERGLYLCNKQKLTRFECEEKRGLITSVALSPNDATVMCGDASGRVEVWQVETGKLIQEIQCSSSITAVAFSPNGLSMGYITEDNSGRIHIIQSQKRNCQLREIKKKRTGYRESTARRSRS